VNYAFLDGQNLYSGVKEQGWLVDYKKLREYLAKKYGVTRAYCFLGYMSKYQSLYTALQSFGYILVFKRVIITRDGQVKGNVDANLVLQAMIDYNDYDRAVIITSDGDFYCLVDHLYDNQKLRAVISPNRKYCSVLLRQSAKEKMDYLEPARHLLEYKKRGTA